MSYKYYIERGWNEVALFKRDTKGYVVHLYSLYLDDMDWRYGHAPNVIYIKTDTKLIELLFNKEDKDEV